MTLYEAQPLAVIGVSAGLLIAFLGALVSEWTGEDTGFDLDEYHRYGDGTKERKQ